MNKKILSLTTTLLLVLLFASCGMRGRNAEQNTAEKAEAIEISDCLDGVIINGVRWATRNVDAPGTFASTPESFGMLFQWNRRKGWNAIDEEVENWDNSIPEGTKWYAKNDPCPEGWRMPTREELKSLEDAGSEWITKNGVYGYLLGLIPNQIFLPAAGGRAPDNGELARVGWLGKYWSATTQYRTTTAWLFWFVSYGSNVTNGWFRGNGSSIRCVAK